MIQTALGMLWSYEYHFLQHFAPVTAFCSAALRFDSSLVTLDWLLPIFQRRRQFRFHFRFGLGFWFWRVWFGFGLQRLGIGQLV